MVPELPWKFDFADGQVPITWVGARYRHVIRDVDGNKVMVKMTTIPKGQRSQAIMGYPDLHDYTIQADLMGTLTNSESKSTASLPDTGLIAQRYTLDLMGDHQELQIRSWTSQLNRFSKTVPFKWEAEHLVHDEIPGRRRRTAKPCSRAKSGSAAKLSPRQWTIEAVDEAPEPGGQPRPVRQRPNLGNPDRQCRRHEERARHRHEERAQVTTVVEPQLFRDSSTRLGRGEIAGTRRTLEKLHPER